MCRFIDENNANEYVTTSHEELMQILAGRKETDRWYTPKISDCEVIGFSRSQEKGSNPLEEYGLTDPAEDEAYGIILKKGAEIQKELMALSNMFLIFPGNDDKKVAYPLYISGLRCTADRMGEAGRTFWDKLSPERKAERLCEDALFYPKECKILIRDEMVVGNHSAGYVILPELELVETMEKALKGDHPDFDLEKGEISLEFLHCWYNLNDKDNEECFALILKDHGIDTEEEPVKCGIEFFTSDTASSAASIFPYFKVKKTKARLGEGIRIEHDGLNSMATWKSRLPEIDSLFKEAEDRIEKMGNTPINNVKETIINITEKYYTKFPKKAVKEISPQFIDGPGNAIDVYLSLCDIIETHCVRNNITGSRKLNLTADVSKFLFRDYTEFDV